MIQLNKTISGIILLSSAMACYFYLWDAPNETENDKLNKTTQTDK